MALAPYPWLEDAARTLAEMRVRLPNAVLIYGPPGIGLYELAFAFAQSLLCENPKPDGEACGECSACALMKAGTHPDCRQVLSEFMCAEHEVPYVAAENERPDAKKRLSREIRIHQIRALADFLGMNANRGGRRVVVVYPADAVRAEAASALLKSMEEPPEGLVYVLACENIDAVLPTIRSRCQTIHFTENRCVYRLPNAENLPEILRRLLFEAHGSLIVAEDCATALIDYAASLNELAKKNVAAKWADRLEVSLFNALAGAMKPDGSWWAYFSPLQIICPKLRKEIKEHLIVCRGIHLVDDQYNFPV